MDLYSGMNVGLIVVVALASASATTALHMVWMALQWQIGPLVWIWRFGQGLFLVMRGTHRVAVVPRRMMTDWPPNMDAAPGRTLADEQGFPAGGHSLAEDLDRDAELSQPAPFSHVTPSHPVKRHSAITPHAPMVERAPVGAIVARAAPIELSESDYSTPPPPPPVSFEDDPPPDAWDETARRNLLSEPSAGPGS